jgi:hypothetical protein
LPDADGTGDFTATDTVAETFGEGHGNQLKNIVTRSGGPEVGCKPPRASNPRASRARIHMRRTLRFVYEPQGRADAHGAPAETSKATPGA